MKLDKFKQILAYLYTDDETGKLLYDYCYSCDNVVHQEDDGTGVFRCEYCKRYNNINILEVEDEWNRFYD